MDDVLSMLKHQRKLERDKGFLKMKKHFAAEGVQPDVIKQLLELCGRECTWQSSQSGFKALALVVTDHGSELADELVKDIIDSAMKGVAFTEFRSRMAAAELAGALGALRGCEIWTMFKPILYSMIEENFERPEADASSQLSSAKQTELKHDTEGWKNLETSFRALQKLAEGIGQEFGPMVDQEMLDLVFRSLLHTNRFVREIGYFTISAACVASDVDSLTRIASQVAPRLRVGLADNWSQVRYAASNATRSFLLRAPTELRDTVWDTLLPPMALNLYYAAQGVQTYSRETWKMIVGAEGRQLLSKHAAAVVPFYKQQSEADNHSVREAACKCIAEMALRVEGITEFVQPLLDALMVCFRDASWPVRDCACTAVGHFVSSYPEECRGQLDELYKLWFAHLSDNIWSVRENSAISLGYVVRAYGKEAELRCTNFLTEHLNDAKKQSPDSHLHSDLTNTTSFGVAAKVARDNDPHLHANQQVFSCGSLAPKLKRATGCMDHGFTRAQEPWEFSDGCLYLLRELAEVNPSLVVPFLEDTVELANLRSFAHFPALHETLYKVMIPIAFAVGQDQMQPVVKRLVGHIVKSTTEESRLAHSAAAQCFDALNTGKWAGVAAAEATEQSLDALKSSEFVESIRN